MHIGLKMAEKQHLGIGNAEIKLKDKNVAKKVKTLKVNKNNNMWQHSELNSMRFKNII